MNLIKFTEFLFEANEQVGIQHLEHPSDLSFDGNKSAHNAIKTLKSVVSGKSDITRKIDDKMSFQAIRTPEGKVGVKYKGTGAHYNFSKEDIEKQHGHKPYLAEPLKALHQHLGKVLPNRPGEYQGGFMSSKETRAEHGGNIEHTPNTITYSAPKNSEEGKKLARSKVSAVIHTELTGANKTPKPITSMSEFGSHPDVHLVHHVVGPEERKLSSEDKTKVIGHIHQAEKLMQGHTDHHLSGHEQTLRSYINKTVDNGDKPSVEGYKKHLENVHNKKIESVKLEKTKQAKQAERDAAIAHVDNNKKQFEKSLEIHHHLQQATNHLARALDKNSSRHGFETKIAGKASGGEGYVARGVKIVDREGFSKANRERTAILRTGKKE